jgi:trehalose/maltose transport system permease protein
MPAHAARAMRQPWGLTAASAAFVGFWSLIAAFPLFWILVMSFKLPLDAFAANPLQVIFGPETRLAAGGLALSDIILGIGAIYAAVTLPRRFAARMPVSLWSKTAAVLGYCAIVAVALLWVLPAAASALRAVMSVLPGLRLLAVPMLGLTMDHYKAVWIEHRFYRQFLNSMIVTSGVVAVSLTVGTLAGYALARAKSNLAFWILLAALVFRALPHSVLVTGYLPVFIDSREILKPLFGDSAPTLYGQPLAVIAVLVAINQPFTIWMLKSFFENIPAELDEAARVDGCSHFGAFWRVIVPVMWPGVITTGLFAFLLAYNDYLVAALLLDAQSMTMVPAITQYFNRETTTTDQIEAVAAAVSITAPLFLLVMMFQKQIVSGLTQGAVKG